MHRCRWALPALMLAFPLALTAQNQLGTLDEINQFGPQRLNFNQRVLGEGAPASAAQLDAAAKYYVYRLTDVNAQGNAQKMGGYVKDFEVMAAAASKPAAAAKNREVVGKFAPHLVKCFKELFALEFGPNRIAIVNGATLLPHAAKMRAEPFGDYLADIVADDKMHDAIRHYAAVSLSEFFPIRPLTKFEQANKANLDRKERDRRRVDALIKFIERPLPQALSQVEFDAQRFVRGEAVASLARTGVPAVTSLGDKVEGPVAVTLLKILANKTQPEPSIRERLEAAIGVCHFNKYVEEYDPKIGVYLVATCLADVFSEYKRDYTNISLKSKGKPNFFPWKHDSKRLDYALTELVNNTSATKSADTARKIASVAKPILQAMYDHQPLNRDVEFRTELQKLRPDSDVLFRDGKKTLLKFELDAPAKATAAKGK